MENGQEEAVTLLSLRPLVTKFQQRSNHININFFRRTYSSDPFFVNRDVRRLLWFIALLCDVCDSIVSAVISTWRRGVWRAQSKDKFIGVLS